VSRKTDPIELAKVEERRQGRGTADLANDSEEIGGGMMCYHTPDSWANEASGLGLDGPVSGEVLDRLVSFYHERGATPRIDVVAHADESLLKGLAERGFTLSKFVNVYVAELEPAEDVMDRLASGPNGGTPEGIQIEVLSRTDDRYWREFCDVATSGFTPRLQPDGSVLPMTDENAELVLRMIPHERTTCISAMVGDKIIGVAAMEIVPGHCCLFGGCVLSEYRRRGVQGWMMAQRFAIAQRAGCKTAVTLTEPGIPTERNCRRLGCDLAYAKVVMEGPKPQEVAC